MLKKDRVEYKKELLDISNFVKARIEFFNEVAKGNLLNIDIKIEDNLKLFVNPIEFQRLIDNNISNAIKYSYPRSTIFIKLYKTRDYIIFKIATKSKKIEDKSKIFSQFFKEDNTKGGFGIGLSLVKDICKKYQFKIELEYKNGYNIFKYRLKSINEDFFTRR